MSVCYCYELLLSIIPNFKIFLKHDFGENLNGMMGVLAEIQNKGIEQEEKTRLSGLERSEVCVS